MQYLLTQEERDELVPKAGVEKLQILVAQKSEALDKIYNAMPRLKLFVCGDKSSDPTHWIDDFTLVLAESENQAREINGDGRWVPADLPITEVDMSIARILVTVSGPQNEE